MSPVQFDENANYRTYVDLLRQLHVLMSTGRGDGPDADDLRDRMDAPWHGLNEAELSRIRGLSADLYSLELDSEPTVEAPTVEDRELMRRAVDARDNGRWDESLDLLRPIARCFPLSLVSYLRGGVWWELGDFETAILFYEHAASLAPDNANYQCIFLDRLVRSGHNDRARDIAEEILNPSGTSHPNVVMRAADVVFNATRYMGKTETAQEYTRLIPILEDALGRVVQLPSEERTESVEIAAIVELGMCFEHLEEYDEAISCYDRALAIDSNHDAALVARGIINYGLETGAAVRDFEAAVRLETPLVWPFFFLGHHSLLEEDYDACVAYARSGLQRDTTLAVRANLLEWIGIAGSMSGMADEDVRACFEEARQLAPDNTRIDNNYREYLRWKEASHEPSTDDANWVCMTEAEVRETGLARLAA